MGARVLSRGFAIGAGLLLLVLSSGAFPVRADTDDPPGRVPVTFKGDPGPR